MIAQADRDSESLNLKEHSTNVAKYSLLIFDNLPLYEKKLWDNVTRTQVYDAGMYHDIGKAFLVRFRAGLLDKKTFSALDKLNVQEHTTAGVVLLQMLTGDTKHIDDAYSDSYHLIRDACLYHHERIDGSGYLGIMHESIPRIGELVSVADCFSAGTEKRCYHDGKSWHDVIAELKEMPLSQIYVNALERGLLKKG